MDPRGHVGDLPPAPRLVPRSPRGRGPLPHRRRPHARPHRAARRPRRRRAVHRICRRPDPPRGVRRAALHGSVGPGARGPRRLLPQLVRAAPPRVRRAVPPRSRRRVRRPRAQRAPRDPHLGGDAWVPSAARPRLGRSAAPSRSPLHAPAAASRADRHLAAGMRVRARSRAGPRGERHHALLHRCRAPAGARPARGRARASPWAERAPPLAAARGARGSGDRARGHRRRRDASVLRRRLGRHRDRAARQGLGPGLVRGHGLPGRSELSGVPPQGRPDRPPVLARDRRADRARRQAALRPGLRGRARARSRLPLRVRRTWRARGREHERLRSAPRRHFRQRALRPLVVRGRRLARPRAARDGAGWTARRDGGGVSGPRPATPADRAAGRLLGQGKRSLDLAERRHALDVGRARTVGAGDRGPPRVASARQRAPRARGASGRARAPARAVERLALSRYHGSGRRLRDRALPRARAAPATGDRDRSGRRRDR